MKFLLFFTIFIFPLLASAQQLNGTIKDAAGSPLDAVTLTLSRQGKQVAYALADSGRFDFKEVLPGQYVLTATLVGYLSVQRELILPKDTVQLVMSRESRQLKEVMITSARPLIERKIDRVTFNLENSIVSSGRSAWDALSNAPGVQARSDNTLTANRKSAVIYLDGKPLNLSGEDLTAYLKGLPSNALAQIEVFTTPPARFDAQGGAVLNIITKKSKKQGANATMNGSYSRATYSSASAGTLVNYREGKLNMYGSYNFSRRKNTMEHDMYIDYGNSFWNSPNYNIYSSSNHNYRLGADYQLSANQILGLLFTGSQRNGGSQGYTPTSVRQLYGSVPDSLLLTESNSATGGNRFTYNMNYNLKMDSGAKTLNIDLDYSPNYTYTNTQVSNVTLLVDGKSTGSQFHIYTPVKQHIHIYSGKADFSSGVFDNWNLSAGVKFSRVNSKNDFDFYNVVQQTYEPVLANANHFKYQESTIAAYTSIAGDIGRLKVQGGLRAEHTRTEGYSQTLDSTNKRNYLKLFPTLFLQYNLNEKHEIQLTYGYRIDRPEYARLNPAKHYSSPYSFYVGNPALQPAFIHSIELGYTYLKKYNLTAYYTETRDLFTNVSFQDNDTKQYYDTQQNLGLSKSAGLRTSVSVQPAEWWDMNVSASGYYQQERSVYLTGRYNYHLFSYDGTLIQNFTLDKSIGLKAELTGRYNGPGIQGIYHIARNWEADAGIKLNILRGQGTLRLTANDIFYTNYYRIKVNYLNQNNGFLHRNDTRNITLSFSYRFGKNVAASRSRNTASEEEKKRAQ